MKGTILTPGVISAEDGKRYTYDAAALKTPEITATPGMAADFVLAEDGSASDVYLIPSSQSAGNRLAASVEGVFSSGGSVASLRTRAIAAIVMDWLVFIPIVGFILAAIAMWFKIQVYRHVSKATGITGFFTLIVAAGGLLLVGVVMAAIGGFGGIASVLNNSNDADAYGWAMTAGMIIMYLAAVCMAMVSFKMAKATGVVWFKVCGILRLCTIIPVIGWVLTLVAVILEIVAWSKTERLIPKDSQ